MLPTLKNVYYRRKIVSLYGENLFFQKTTIMKKKTILSMLLAVMTVGLSAVFTSCSSDDDENKFDYPMETVYGTWETTAVKQKNGDWLDLTSWVWAEYRAKATFYSDGTYTGSGALGNGSGTYTVAGNTIVTYVNGKEYTRYVVSYISSDGTEMQGTMSDKTSSIEFKAKKKK